MGLDLTLIVVQWESVEPWWPSTMLRLDRDYKLFDLVRPVVQAHGRPVPGPRETIRWPDEKDGMVERDRDPYGDPLRFVRTNWLAPALAPAMEWQDDTKLSTWNAAAVAWLQLIARSTMPVVLYWS